MSVRLPFKFQRALASEHKFETPIWKFESWTRTIIDSKYVLIIISDLLLFLGSHFILPKTTHKKLKPLLSSMFSPTSGILLSISVPQHKQFNLTILTCSYKTKSLSVKSCKVQYLDFVFSVCKSKIILFGLLESFKCDERYKSKCNCKIKRPKVNGLTINIKMSFLI